MLFSNAERGRQLGTRKTGDAGACLLWNVCNDFILECFPKWDHAKFPSHAASM